MAARRDLGERILADTGRVLTRGSRELRSTQLLRRVRRDQRFLHATLSSTKRRVARRSRDPQAVHAGASARRDEAAHDHVLLEAKERIDLALDRRLGEDAGGLLERGRRDEAAGLERRLGDAKQHRLALRLLLLLLELGVDLVHLVAIDLLAGQQRSVAAVGDLDL